MILKQYLRLTAVLILASCSVETAKPLRDRGLSPTSKKTDAQDSDDVPVDKAKTADSARDDGTTPESNCDTKCPSEELSSLEVEKEEDNVNEQEFKLKAHSAPVNSNPTFYWNALPAASGYEVKLATDKSCKDVVLDQHVVKGTSASFENVPKGSYFLCVSGKTPSGMVAAKNQGLPVEVRKGWYGVSAKDAPSDRVFPSLAYVDGAIYLWGGTTIKGHESDGYRYDVAKNSWTKMKDPPDPKGRTGAAFTYLNGKIYRLGGAHTDGVKETVTGLAYDPAKDSWTTFPERNDMTHNRYLPLAMPFDGKIILVGSNKYSMPESVSFDPANNDFTDLNITVGRSVVSAMMTAYSSDHGFVFGGQRNSSFYGTGFLFDPKAKTFRQVTSVNAPAARESGCAVWTGKEYLLYGGDAGANANRYRTFGDLYSYDPSTDRWQTLIANDISLLRTAHACVWTGHAMFVAGGGANPRVKNDPPRLYYP